MYVRSSYLTNINLKVLFSIHPAANCIVQPFIDNGVEGVGLHEAAEHIALFITYLRILFAELCLLIDHYTRYVGTENALVAIIGEVLTKG